MCPLVRTGTEPDRCLMSSRACTAEYVFRHVVRGVVRQLGLHLIRRSDRHDHNLLANKVHLRAVSTSSLSSSLLHRLPCCCHRRRRRHHHHHHHGCCCCCRCGCCCCCCCSCCRCRCRCYRRRRRRRRRRCCWVCMLSLLLLAVAVAAAVLKSDSACLTQLVENDL